MDTVAQPPKIDDAPGLRWKKIMKGWAASWQARTDLRRGGFKPTSVRLWAGAEADLTSMDIDYIQTNCRSLQDSMLIWAKGGAPVKAAFDGTVRSLIYCYETDEDSPYRKLEYKTREHYGVLTKRLHRDMGDLLVADIRGRDVKRLHDRWIQPNEEGGREKITMGHGLVSMLRILVNFGAAFLENGEPCERLANTLSRMKFQMGKPRTVALTAEQADAIRAKLHEMGLHSIAIGQSGQFECILRQKDVIGEWVPLTERGTTDVFSGNMKWLKGLRWEEIDASLILRHVTSKRKKLVEINLRLLPMVMEELCRLAAIADPAALTRDMLPAKGPVIVSELTGVPWTNGAYRWHWRRAARACGIPDEVRNMDSRAGAITEALLAGAAMDDVRKSATHENSIMTQRYSRGFSQAGENVANIRVADRNKRRTLTARTDSEPQ